MSLGRYRRDLDGVMQSLLRVVLSILLGNIRPDIEREEQIERLTPLLTEEVRVARNRAHQIAAHQLLNEAPEGRVVYIPAQRGYPSEAVRTVLEKNLSGTPSEASNRIASELVRHAEQAGRDTIVDAVLDEEWKGEPEDPRKKPGDDPEDEYEGYIPGKSRLKIDFGDIFDEDEDLWEDLEEELDRSTRQNDTPVRPIGWARVMTGAETCAFCVMLASRPGSGERRFYTSADAAGGELAKAEYYGTALFVNRYHTNCVIPGTLVDGPPADAAYSRPYHGEVVQLRTAGGKDLTITPQHPVLTDRGWVPAGLLEEGDHLVSAPRVRREGGSRPHEHHGPSRIEDVFSAFSMVRGAVRRSVPGSAEQFHGDGANAEIDVIDVNNLLRDEANPPSGQPLPELGFELTAPSGLPGSVLSRDSLRSSQLGRPAAGGTPQRVVGGLDLGVTLLGGHFRCPVHTGGGAVSRSDTGGADRVGDHRSADTGVFGQGVDGFSLAIPLDQPWRDGNPLLGRVGVSRKFDPTSLYSDSDGLATYTKLGSDLLERFSGAVEFDRLVDKTVSIYQGRVLNLSTVEGWYGANGITVSNCDCVVVPVYDENNWTGREIADRLYEDVYLAALDGKPAKGWRSNKYSENDVVKLLEKWLKSNEYQLPSIRELV